VPTTIRWAQPTLPIVPGRNNEKQVEAPSQDSFLDVVCNVVGILIVLVLLIAAQAKRGMIATATAGTQAAAVADNSAAEAEAHAAEATAASLEHGLHELEMKIYQEKLAAAAQDDERQKFQLLVDIAEQRLAEYRNQLSAEERARYDLEQELVKSKGELSSLQTTPVSFTKPKPHILEHLPTPMARTVFGTEIHFRLLNHRLAYVPFDEMKERLMTDARNQIHKMKDTPRAEFSLPEVAGFGARYILRRTEGEVETRAGTQKHAGVELELIYLVDVEQNLGQPIAQALGPASEFRGRLASCRPQNTTVTIWVYPDSFDDFRALKAELFRLGYLSAARPMPMGEPIAGSPSGHRSAAE
jgi:hypothetical protein